MATSTWNVPLSGDWSAPGDWVDGFVPVDGDSVILGPGAYTSSIASGETFHVADMINQAAMVLQGTLLLDGTYQISAGGSMLGGGVVYGFGALNNGGVIGNTGTLGFTQIATSSFTNTGTVLASGSGGVAITSANFTNLANNVLTGGVLEVDGPAFGSFSEILINIGGGTASEISTINGTVTINGAAAEVVIYNGSVFAGLSSTLTGIGASGVLNIVGGHDYFSSNAIANDGLLTLGGGEFGSHAISGSGSIRGFGSMESELALTGTIEASGGILVLSNTVADTASMVVDANAALALSGAYTQPVVDNGAIEALGGLLKLSGPISGSGGFIIDAGTINGASTLELNTASSGSVLFNGVGATLRLDNPASFTGAINGFGTGGVIDLAGIAADSTSLSGGVLTILNAGTPVYALALSGDYSAASFSVATDGAGGTNVTVSGKEAQNFEFEGPYWHSKTITWSFATANHPELNVNGHTEPVFSNFFTTGTLPGDTRDQTQYQDIVEQAFARWATIAGFNFVEVPDSLASDLRIGWADFTGGPEIGRADYSFQSDVMLADSIVRLQDPTEIALDANAQVIGGLAYHNSSSTMYQVALHEIGHALGMDHSTDLNAVMNPVARGVTNQDADASDINGIRLLYAAVACYAEGTHVLTERGEVTVENLRVGDRLPGLRGGVLRPIRWIGHRRLRANRHPRPQDVWPVRVRAGAFADGVPHRDLWLSPDHAVFVDGVLVPVRLLVNGGTIAQVARATVSYWHVELAEHDVILAEGMAAESYLDTGNRSDFANGGTAVTVHPDFARVMWQARACAVQVRDGVRLDAIRAALAARVAQDARAVRQG